MSEKNSKLLEVVVKALDDKRAKDIVALNMTNVSIITDYNVITHGGSSRQINALAQSVTGAAAENGFEVNRVEGKNSTKWLLIDLGEVVVHIFSEEERDFFKLESLWSEAQTVDITSWLA